MAYRQVPFFKHLGQNPSRLESAAQLLARQLCADAARGSFYPLAHRLEFFRRHLDASRSQAYNLVVRQFFQRAADLCAERNIFSPQLAMLLPRRPRAPIPGVALADFLERSTVAAYDGRDFQAGSDARWIRQQITVRPMDHNWPSLSYIICENCSAPFPTGRPDAVEMVLTWDHSGHICPHCAPQYRALPYYAMRFVHRDNIVSGLDPENNEVDISEHDHRFIWDDDRELRVHRSWYDRHRTIRGYHSSKGEFQFRQDDWTRRYNRYMGVELEVEVTRVHPETAATNINRAVNGEDYGSKLFFERDGSLNSGFEMITNPSSLPALRDTFQFLNNPDLVRPLRSHATRTCGLHVHVSRAGLTNLNVSRAVLFVNDMANQDFISALARRYNTGYCLVAPKSLETAHLSQSRYEAVNLTGRHTLEFRVFRGSLKYEAVIAALEFCHALMEYCARPEVTVAGLTWRPFLDWCATDLEGDTRFLRPYIAERMQLPTAPPHVLNTTIPEIEA